MANAAKFRDLAGFSEHNYNVAAEYDFDNDTGAQGTFSLAKFHRKTLVRSGIVFVETQCTSGGAATVIVGTSVADDDAFMDIASGAVGNLVDDFIVAETTGVNLVVAADETLDLTIATADLTAGKIKVYLDCINVD
jgi:hypothetical protein